MRYSGAKRALWGAAVVALTGLLSGPVVAQSQQQAQPGGSADNGLQEVVVTATRRAERLQDVPISVTAFGQEQMDAQGLRNIDDLTRLSPGVTFQRNGTGSSANYNDENSDINIRGVDSTAGTSTTGIYIDDTPIQSRHIGFGAVNAFPALFDLDRVEVLRGPQGTLFGAGSEGGTVRFISPEPSLSRTSTYVRSELATTRHGDPSYELGAAYGGTLIDGVLGYRVSASYRRDGGYVDRVGYSVDAADQLATPVFTHTIESAANWQRTATLRAALKWAVNDNVNVTPSIYYQELHINDTAAYWEALSDRQSAVFRNGNALPNPSTDPFWLAAVKVEWNLGFAQLTSNTSYLRRDQRSVSDYTQYLRSSYLPYYFNPLTNQVGISHWPQPGDAGTAPFRDEQRNFYQEVRLTSADAAARLTWNSGVFFSLLKESVPENIYDPTLDAESFGQLCAATPCPGGLLFYGPDDRVTDKQAALFGEASYKLTQTLKVTAGLRVSRVQFKGESLQAGTFVGPTIYSVGSASETPLTPKLVISWQPDRDQLYYASAAKGYRVGGTNADVGIQCEGDLGSVGVPLSADGLRHVPPTYSSDHLWSYEIGTKNTLLERRLQVDASLFVIDWQNIQQNVYLPSCGQQFVSNLGRVRSQGGELQLNYRPVQSLLTSFTVAYTDAKYSKTSCAGVLQYNGTNCVGNGAAQGFLPIVHEGNRLVGAPWTFFATGEYSFPGWSEHTPYLRADFQYTTAQTALLPGQDPTNGLNDTTIPGLPITRNLSMRGGLRWSGFDLSAFVDNATGSQPLLYRSRDIADDSNDKLYFQRSVRPRTFGVTLTYRR
ncbi:MAG: TonB-dependent receptor [Proteobacteria bacterium]|nr:TonB-dependent receptor [Pseudomonadota bacterium]